MKYSRIFLLLPLIFFTYAARSQVQTQATADEVQQLKQLVFELQRRVSALEQQNRQSQTDSAADPYAAVDLASATAALRDPEPAPAPTQITTVTSTQPTPPLPGTLLGGATLNYYLDGYYEYNFNAPIGRVNNLRAYDVLSNTFSLNQADVIFDLDPDVSAHRRYGFRLDLQFGQATATLQGNPANEPRPEIYRNIFQAYGTYVVPVGHGIDIDFGKWASSLGMEGNYTKDQMNYTRSYYFLFLPFYHEGIRASYKFDDKLTANYWIDNGTNQSEPTNGYKDELFGFAAQPIKTINWTFNYYNGQEHPNTVAATDCTVPVQPGLCVAPITPSPNGKVHIFDSYANWQALPRLTLAGEGDYVIEREWANAAPDHSSAPAHVDGGAAYAQYQVTQRAALAARAEYLSDRGGLFSNVTQALKETTGTYKYSLGDNFDVFLEYRRDWSNKLYFITATQGTLSSHQDTTTLGLVWWYGGKEGSW